MTPARRHLISAACWLVAIVITVTLSLVASAFDVFWVFWLVTVWWAVDDWKRVGIWRYENGISQRPETIVSMFFLFGWPIYFPWYLAMRLKIWLKVARLHDDYDPGRPAASVQGATGLVQPWRGRRI